MIINRIYENQNLLSLQLVSFLIGLRTYQQPCSYKICCIRRRRQFSLEFNLLDNNSTITLDYVILIKVLVTFAATAPQWARASSFTKSLDHTQTHHIRQDSSGRVISSLQGPLPDNTQHSQETDIHSTSGIRTHTLSRRAAADPRVRPRGHWDRVIKVNPYQNNRKCYMTTF